MSSFGRQMAEAGFVFVFLLPPFIQGDATVWDDYDLKLFSNRKNKDLKVQMKHNTPLNDQTTHCAQDQLA